MPKFEIGQLVTLELRKKNHFNLKKMNDIPTKRLTPKKVSLVTKLLFIFFQSNYCVPQELLKTHFLKDFLCFITKIFKYPASMNLFSCISTFLPEYYERKNFQIIFIHFHFIRKQFFYYSTKRLVVIGC